MPGSLVSALSSPGVARVLPPPEMLAARCRQLGLPGLVWLDSATGGSRAQSILAACPLAMMHGTPADWQSFDRERRERRRAHPAGAAIGWVEYDGNFQFGFYPEPLVYDHDTAGWFFPGGSPEWLNECEGVEDEILLWDQRLDFSFEVAAEQFCRWVEAAQEHIRAGNIYQVNLAHRLHAPWPADGDALALYLALRAVSPAPMAGFLALDDKRTVLCSSPEEFLTFADRRVRTRPIKGTRPRGHSLEADRAAATELLGSAKERAELLMITDLLRNDLGQVCEYGSVRVDELFGVERFAQVFHLVSTVEGHLWADVSHAEALRMCLPGGSITGAPKLRAREIIAELETAPRGLYTGSIGAFLGGEESRFNIAIRTLIIENGVAHFHVGAGIVADSDPGQEWAETLHKARGILRAAASGEIAAAAS